ncbi:MAG: hypothetical protein J6S83_13065, partial [Lachnospiraceae bacterium]|nr:hypothetical protein [Lachnospiraceae bacterium]
ITVVGTPENGDSIIVEWVKEIRGTITNATPTAFGVTGWNLYNQTAGYARVVRYSEEYGYKISGSYSALAFSETESGAQTAIVPDSSGLFQVPSDGFLFVTGGNSTTAIWATWADWINGYSGDFQAYTKSTISLSMIMGTLFPDGLCAVEGVRDYIDITGGYAYNWIDVLEYSEENLAVAEASGRPYLYDEDNIYLARASALITALTGALAISGAYTVNGHGLEMFDGTMVPVGGMTSYGVDLRNKLERDVLTKSQQTLSASEQAQVRGNIGAAASSDVNTINTKLASLFKYIEYRYTIASLAADTNLNITATNFGISTPSGYKPVAPGKMFTGSANFQLANVNHTATGGATAMSVRNNANSTQTGKVAVLGILYVRTGFGI